MNYIKSLVLNILSQSHGQSKAIKGKDIAIQLGLRDDRQVRLAIRELIKDGVPIAALVDKPYGYYIAETYQEAQAYMAGLRSRLIENARRRRDFKVAAYRYFEGSRQISLL